MLFHGVLKATHEREDPYLAFVRCPRKLREEQRVAFLRQQM